MRRMGILVFGVMIGALSAWAQIQEAWVDRYNNGLSNRIHQAVAMALDTNGNIYVAGSSEASAGNSDYALIKYAANGTLLWVRHYGTATDERPNALVLDHFGNAIITGSGGTAKYTSAGALLWSNGYAGHDVTVDPNDNVIVTGFSTNDFATVKLNPMGSNLWVRTYDGHGYDDVSQRVATDSSGNVYIAGSSVWWLNRPPGIPSYYELLTIKYHTDGTRLWASTFRHGPSTADARGIVVDSAGDVVITGELKFTATFVTRKYFSENGSNIWAYSDGNGEVRAMTIGMDGNVYLVGQLITYNGFYEDHYKTVKLDTQGTEIWSARYGSALDTGANALALHQTGNVYVTGVSPQADTGNDFATIRYATDGRELWVKRYNGPANGNDEGKAIAVDAAGTVYVAGTSANTNGGTDIVLIKYAELQIIRILPNGHVLVQFFGTPGHSYRFQGSINLSNWVELGSSIADPNGIYRFEDTNAPAYPHRFYRTVTP